MRLYGTAPMRETRRQFNVIVMDPQNTSMDTDWVTLASVITAEHCLCTALRPTKATNMLFTLIENTLWRL
jgi:hypothetical protein